MSFQFQCPNGHLLEGEAADAGLPCPCPTCGVEFLIPAPIDAVEPVAAPPTFPDLLGRKVEITAESADFEKPPDLIHIPCPNGHQLETPRDMLNQDALCPYCDTRFRLRERDSVEFRMKKAKELETNERRLGKAWLNWVIILVVLALCACLLMIMMHQ